MPVIRKPESHSRTVKNVPPANNIHHGAAMGALQFGHVPRNGTARDDHATMI
jgi:hypothetical protein